MIGGINGRHRSHDGDGQEALHYLHHAKLGNNYGIDDDSSEGHFLTYEEGEIQTVTEEDPGQCGPGDHADHSRKRREQESLGEHYETGLGRREAQSLKHAELSLPVKHGHEHRIEHSQRHDRKQDSVEDVVAIVVDSQRRVELRICLSPAQHPNVVRPHIEPDCLRNLGGHRTDRQERPDRGRGIARPQPRPRNGNGDMNQTFVHFG